MAAVQYERGPAGERLAFLQDGPPDDQVRTGLFWLGGFMSDMQGTKATDLAAMAREARRACLRFDYSGHGQSSGEFTDGTISAWLEQAIHMFISRTSGKRIIVGSSMGGWLALLLLRTLLRDDPGAARRIHGLVLIAPAPDMTRDLMWQYFSEEVRQELEETGIYNMPSAYGAPYPISLKLITDGQHHLVLQDGMDVRVPIRIIQGTDDVDVPPSHAFKLLAALRGKDITLTLVKGADHRMSAPSQLAIIRAAVQQLATRADGLYA
jgi:pimeloyl-ACP methyl ester carboxylesterase